MKYSRFLVILTPLIIFFLLELNSRMFYVSMLFSLLLIFFTIVLILKKQKKERKIYDYLKWTILPLIFFLGLDLYSIIVINKILMQVLFLVNVSFLYFYFKNFYYFSINSDYYKKDFFENAASYGNFLAIFFFSASLYGMQSLLGISTWVLVVSLSLVFFLAICNVANFNDINIKKNIPYILTIILILIELSWTLSFLFAGYNILGIVLAICYYIIIGLFRFYFKGNLSKKTIKMYLIFGFLSIILILLSSRWM